MQAAECDATGLVHRVPGRLGLFGGSDLRTGLKSVMEEVAKQKAGH